jgi:hypothetical protein
MRYLEWNLLLLTVLGSNTPLEAPQKLVQSLWGPSLYNTLP